jgi:hypothetical protein
VQRAADELAGQVAGETDTAESSDGPGAAADAGGPESTTREPGATSDGSGELIAQAFERYLRNRDESGN